MSCVEEKRRLSDELRRVRTELAARNRQLDQAIIELKRVRDFDDRSQVSDCLFLIGGIMATRDEARDLFVSIARHFIGVQEVGGDNKGPEVEMFQKAVDGKAQGEPWCSAFVMFCLAQTEAQEGVFSDVFRSEKVKNVWDYSNNELKHSTPEVGDLVCWQHGDSDAGHIGIVETVGVDYMITIEGNTGPGSGIEREGDGVYRKTRPLANVGRMKLLGFLRVF